MYRTEPFTTELCRISYAQGLYTARSINGGAEKHSVTLIFPKTSIKKLHDAIAEVVQNEWGEKGVDRFKRGLIKNPILAGDGKSAHDKEGNLKKGLGPDVVFIRPTSNDPVKCFDKAVQPLDAREVKSGYWGKASINAFAWHNDQSGDGISFGINMFQLIKEDEILGGDGNVDPDKAFERETVETDDEGSQMTEGAGSMFD